MYDLENNDQRYKYSRRTSVASKEGKKLECCFKENIHQTGQGRGSLKTSGSRQSREEKVSQIERPRGLKVLRRVKKKE